MITFSNARQSRLKAAARDLSGLVIGPTYVGGIDRPVDNGDGVAAHPDVVAVALYMHAASAAQCGARFAM